MHSNGTLTQLQYHVLLFKSRKENMIGPIIFFLRTEFFGISEISISMGYGIGETRNFICLNIITRFY